MSDDEDPKFPRLIAGQWEEVSFEHEDIFDLIRSGFADYFGNQRVILESDKLNLWDGKKLVQSIEIEPAPASPYPNHPTCDHLVRFSPDGQFIWHLGYHSNIATCFLYDGQSLETLDQFVPHVHDLSTNSYDKVNDWGELEARVHSCHPSAIAIHANLGDDISMLYGLIESDRSIVNPSSNLLYEFAASILDERIGDAGFVGSNQILILDDVGCITSCSFPMPESRKRIWLHPMLENEEYNIHVWPEHSGENYFESSRSLGISDGHVLVSLLDPYFNHPKNISELIATMVLDHELRPIGFMKPPVSDCEELTQFKNGLFANRQGFWKPVFYDHPSPIEY